MHTEKAGNELGRLETEFAEPRREFFSSVPEMELGNTLHAVFEKRARSFSELKKILGVNSRTLSDKLKSLTQYAYVERTVRTGSTPKSGVQTQACGKGHRVARTTAAVLFRQSGLARASSQSSSRAWASVEWNASLLRALDKSASRLLVVWNTRLLVIYISDS